MRREPRWSVMCPKGHLMALEEAAQEVGHVDKEHFWRSLSAWQMVCRECGEVEWL